MLVKLLLDTCVWKGAADQLRAVGHDVVWIGDQLPDPGDEAILRLGHSEHRIVVTIDKDFGELAVLHGLPHHGIVRIVGFSARQQGAVCLRALESHGDELLAGAIITAEPGRMRIRPPEGSS